MTLQSKAGGDAVAAILEMLIKFFGKMLGHITLSESGEINVGMVFILIIIVLLIGYGIHKFIKYKK